MISFKITSGRGAPGFAGRCRVNALVWTILGLAMVLPGVGRARAAALQVVATTPDLGAVAREVGGVRVEVVSLARAQEDPHFVDPRPAFMVKLNRADVLVEGGASLEAGWLPPLLEGARNSRLSMGAPGRISAARGIELLEVPASLDRSRGDIHESGNPHYTVDPENLAKVAGTLAASFRQLDPAGALAYDAALGSFRGRLDSKLDGWKKRLEPYRDRRIVCYHNSWLYFAKRFGLRMDLFLEPKPGIPPSPSHLSALIETMKTEKVRVIVLEPFLNRKTAEAVAARTGALIVELAPYPDDAKKERVVDWMDGLVNALAKGLANP